VQIPNALRAMSTHKPLHIVDTSFLDGNDVLVRFSDGSAAIYEAEELEKLRPTPKQMLANYLGAAGRLAYANTP
jgi:hypothetical protein